MFPEIRGSFFTGPHNMDSSIWVSLLGVLYGVKVPCHRNPQPKNHRKAKGSELRAWVYSPPEEDRIWLLGRI